MNGRGRGLGSAGEGIGGGAGLSSGSGQDGAPGGPDGTISSNGPSGFGSCRGRLGPGLGVTGVGWSGIDTNPSAGPTAVESGEHLYLLK